MINGRRGTHTAVFFFLKALLLLVNGNATGAQVDKEKESTNNRESLEKVVLEEVTVRVETIRNNNMSIAYQTNKYEKRTDEGTTSC